MIFSANFARQGLLRALVLIALAFGAASSARADCPTQGLPLIFTYGTVAVSNSLAVGEIIPGTVQAFRLSGTCAAPSLYNRPIVACPPAATPIDGMTGVYTTGVTAVGMRMRDSTGKPLVGTGGCSTDSSLGNVGADGTFNVSGTFELVKTGTITGGAFASSAAYNTGVLGSGIVLNNGNSYISVASGTPVRAVSCSVTAATANQTIYLARVSPAMLASAGAVTAQTPFSIGLSCSAGVKVAVTFVSASGNSGIASVLASTGTATGVGIQLLDSSRNAITLNTALQLTSGTTGDMTFQFYGQYYRLGAPPVTSGTVNASVIFTMSYQ